MRLFEFLHKYFGFNKRERNGIIILLAIIICLIFVKIFLPTNTTKKIEINLTKVASINEEEHVDNTHYAFQSDSDSLINNSRSDKPEKDSSQLFSFDPNTISKVEAIKLGFPAKLATTLDNFRSKGGKFRSKEDLKKLFGMKEKLYLKLENYILIPSPTNEFKSAQKETYSQKSSTIIDINTADSLQLLSLPMIGPAFTKKIIKFRNALGGFYKIEQLKEVYGMQDSTYNAIANRIRASRENIRKININTSTVEQLKKHPYLSFGVASSIVNYREKHGRYNTLEDLKLTGTINDALLEKLKNYIEFQ